MAVHKQEEADMAGSRLEQQVGPHACPPAHFLHRAPTHPPASPPAHLAAWPPNRQVAQLPAGSLGHLAAQQKCTHALLDGRLTQVHVWGAWRQHGYMAAGVHQMQPTQPFSAENTPL